jgi:hypothetical protein
MLATYTLQTCLVTVYLIALVMIRFDWILVNMRNVSFMKRTLLAIQHSTGSFLSASFVFCIAMLLASLLSEVDDNSNARGTAWTLLLTMPVSSILPVVVLQLAASDTLRRVKGRMALWSLVFTLNLALLVPTIVAAFDISEEEKSKFKFSYSAWEIKCLDTYYILPMPIISWVIAGSACLSMGFYIIISAVASLRRHGPRKYVHRPGKLWWSMIILAFVAMWTFIGWFMWFAFLVRNSARNSNKDKEWFFRQILALATWAPFTVEFAYTWWEEPE